ncbi:MAG: antitoxin family protein [Anaerolineae bacterium]
MSNSITAIYENGVLRPLTPLELPENTQVQIQVHRVSMPAGDSIAHRRRVREALIAAALSLPTPEAPPTASPLSAERRQELAQLFSAGRPLSELIVEEREGR